MLFRYQNIWALNPMLYAIIVDALLTETKKSTLVSIKQFCLDIGMTFLGHTQPNMLGVTTIR